MNMNYRSLTLSILLGMIVHFAVEAQTLPEKQFFHPDRVKYDKDCFTIEGKDIFILSAAFHYFRCPQELWRDRFRKIKEPDSILWKPMSPGIGMNGICRRVWTTIRNAILMI